jgi:hypothetical protein
MKSPLSDHYRTNLIRQGGTYLPDGCLLAVPAGFCHTAIGLSSGAETAYFESGYFESGGNFGVSAPQARPSAFAEATADKPERKPPATAVLARRSLGEGRSDGVGGSGGRSPPGLVEARDALAEALDVLPDLRTLVGLLFLGPAGVVVGFAGHR